MSVYGDEDILSGSLNGEEFNNSFENFDELPQEEEDGIVNDIVSDTDKVKVEPKKRSIRNPRLRLSVEVLCGPRGLHTIEEYFKDIQFKGKGYEQQDLDEIIKRLQHWGHRMYPNYKFDDILSIIERLGKKKSLQTHISRYRLGMLSKDVQHVNDQPFDEVITPTENNTEIKYDEFDALINEQIEMSKICNASKRIDKQSSYCEEKFSHREVAKNNDTQLTKSSVEQARTSTSKMLTAEQMARLAENRRLAQERLAAKRASQYTNNNS